LKKIEWMENMTAQLLTAAADLPAVVHNGKIYVFGGYGADANTCLANIQIYDPAADQWTQGCRLNHTRWGATAEVVNGKIYIFGGASDNNNSFVTTCEIYNPEADTTIDINKQLPSDLQNQGLISAVVGDLIYIFCENYVYSFDPTTKTFTEKTCVPVYSRWGVCSYVNVNGQDRIYILGGWNGNSADNKIIYYLPDNDKWVNLSSEQHGVALTPEIMYGGTREGFTDIDENIIYAMGQGDHGVFYATLYLYNPTLGIWSDVTNTSLTERDGVATAVINNVLYIIGGRNVPDHDNPCGLTIVETIKLSKVKGFSSLSVNH
jgi:N-acetylneuraminic acid mutarotase